MASPSVFTHDILPRIRAGHPVLSIVTHEWERVEGNLLVAGDVLNQVVEGNNARSKFSSSFSFQNSAVVLSKVSLTN